MSLVLLKRRILSLFLFFIDYKALLGCFTILTLSISSSNLLERQLFEDQYLSFELIFENIVPALALNSIVIVSYKLFAHVYFFTTIVKIFLLSIFVVLISTFVKYKEISNQIQNVRRFTGKNVWVTGVITSQEKSNTYLFDSSGTGLGNSLVRFGQYPVLHTGQKCKLMGKVVQPKSFEEFDYRKYLFRKGIYSILEVEEYQCSNWGNIFLEFRYRLERIVEKSIPEPEASLLIGIMFGSKRVFQSEFNTALNSSGISHVIAASGYNVALVAVAVEGIFKGRGNKMTIVMKILCIWCFSIFSGLSSSLIRASVMTSLSLFALLFGRESNPAAVLLLCATVLILLNPFIIYDVGFLFSFVSVTGLIFLPKCFVDLRSRFIKENVLPTVTCIFFTLPISVIYFGKVSVISLISNIVILPIVSSTIFWGLISTISNVFLPFKILFLIPYIQLNIFKQFVLVSSNIDMLEIHIDKYLFGICIYLILFLFCLFKYPVSSNNYYILQAKKYE